VTQKCYITQRTADTSVVAVVFTGKFLVFLVMYLTFLHRILFVFSPETKRDFVDSARMGKLK